MHTRLFGALAGLLCFLSFGAVGARADVGWPEWMPVASSRIGGASAIYFFDATHACFASANGLYYLGPGNPMGLKWDHANEPGGVGFIRQIRFIQGKLYATSAGTDVLVSGDSGQNWSYSGLNLVDANDIYADGSGKLRMLQDPMKVFERLDTLHCIAQGNAQIFVSNDGGLTWASTGVPMVDSASVGAFADRCKNIYVCPNSWGSVFRSTDLGQTWQTIVTGSGPGSEYLNGASTVVYESSSAGMFRSIDDGADWISVITVTGFIPALDVWGPMGEHIAVYATGGIISGIWLSTTGGLDDLHSGINMTDSNGAPLMQQDTFNVPWELSSTCNPYLIPIALWADVDGLSEKVTLSDSLGDFALLGRDSVSLRIHREDTIWMQYDPHHPVSNAVLTFENHWHCSDWTETRTVHVDAIPKALITPPLIFTSSCIPDTAAALLRLDSCQTLCIDSIVIPSSIAPNFRLLTPLPDTASIGVRDSLVFAFTSSGTSDTLFDSVLIYAHYLGLDSILDDYFYFPHAWGDDTDFSLFSTTVPVTLHSLASGKVLSANISALHVHPSYLCEERDTFAVIRDIGCDTVCVSAIALSGTGFRLRDTTTPFLCLAPGETDTVFLETQVDTSGHPNTNIDTLAIASDAQPPLAPIILSREIQYPVTWELRLSPPDSAEAGAGVDYRIIQHGTLPPDDTSVDFVLVFYDDLLSLNGVDEPWTIISGSYRGADGEAHYRFHVSPIPQDSVIATVHFTGYQAPILTTQLALDSVEFASNLSRPSDCIASASLASSQFTIRTSCNGPLLSETLNGILTIDGVSPNPTTGEVLVRYTLHGASVDAAIELEDALGRTVLQKTEPLVSEPNQTITLDLSALSTGMYLVRIETPSATRSQSIIRK